MKAAHYAFLAMAAVSAAGFVTSCSTTRKTAPAQPHRPAVVSHPPSKAGPKATGKIAEALVSEARTWLGVPYKTGGKTRAGADCSGFLMTVYRDAAGISLPRTTADQWLHCSPVDRDKAAVGDIIFFSSRNSRGKIAHVGMYVGNGRMIHASTSRGVVEDDLSLKYYVDHYIGTGRVPQIADATPAVEDARRHVPDIIAPPAPELPRIAATVHVDSLPALFARANREKAAAEVRSSEPLIITVVDEPGAAVNETPVVAAIESPVVAANETPVVTVKESPVVVIEPVTAVADTVAKPAETPSTVVANAFSKFK